MTYSVYKIEVSGVVRYWGYTNNLKRRLSQHKTAFRTNKKKILYDNLRLEDFDVNNLSLKIDKEFSKKSDAKRWEAFQILKDYFNKNELWQKVPNISDR